MERLRVFTKYHSASHVVTIEGHSVTLEFNPDDSATVEVRDKEYIHKATYYFEEIEHYIWEDLDETTTKDSS